MSTEIQIPKVEVKRAVAERGELSGEPAEALLSQVTTSEGLLEKGAMT